MATVLSVNVGRLVPTVHSDFPVTGIDKRPVAGPVEITDPGTSPTSGLAGDGIGDTNSHGGHEQAVYAYAREDLDAWQAELGRSLPSGVFGENLTTLGLDLNDARIGERWRIGERCVLEVSCPRIPCRTFAGWLGENAWERRFTLRATPGAYLRVVMPGPVRAGDQIAVEDRPDHDVTIRLMFRALTREKNLLPLLAPAGDALPAETRALVAALTAASAT
ncbi:MAG TPA: MOSC domain-containing protein [Candidatus Binatia bacterium]|nr:MOSC domain-containing protein [Candidatus Binatia bacterium]